MKITKSLSEILLISFFVFVACVMCSCSSPIPATMPKDEFGTVVLKTIKTGSGTTYMLAVKPDKTPDQIGYFTVDFEIFSVTAVGNRATFSASGILKTITDGPIDQLLKQ